MGEKSKYFELSKAKIQESRNMVISKSDTFKGYTLAQQICIQEGNRETLLFIKGAIHVDTLEGLYNLRDALNEAIIKEENQSVKAI